MNITEKAYQLALKLRDPERVFSLTDVIADVLWKAFAHKWDTRYADVAEGFNALENVVLKGWNVKPRIIADIMFSVRGAITDGYEWHTPLSETVDRRPEETKRSIEGKLKYAIRLSDGTYWYGYNCWGDDALGFGCLPLGIKKRASEQPIDRSEARFHFFCPFYAQNARKNLSCLGRQKRFLSWCGCSYSIFPKNPQNPNIA